LKGDKILNQVHSEIKSWLEANKEQIISDIIEALKINSESNNRAEAKKSLKQVLDVAQKLGFRSELRAEDQVGVVFFGEGTETLGILTHADIVPVGDPKLWFYSPYGEFNEGKIYGRGAVDNKGMVISSLYAMAAVKALNMPVYKKLELIIGTREEIVWDDIYLYKEEGHPLPDYGFTPDGEFPITNREKGNCEIHMIFRGGDCPGEFEVPDIKSGEVINSVPGKAIARVRGNIEEIKAMVMEFNRTAPEAGLELEQICTEEATIAATGKTAHSSMPEQGINAMTFMCLFLSRLKVKNAALEEYVKFVADHFNDNYYGSSLGLPDHPEFLNGEEMGKTTAVPTMVYVDDGIHLLMSIRTVYGTTREEIADAFDRLSSKYGFSYTFVDYLDPLYVSKEHKFIELLSRTYEEVTKEKAELILTGGTTYAKALPGSVAFGPVFPKDDDMCHQTDEYISVDKLMKATEIYALVIARVLLDKESFLRG